jgi:hypothetical protein
MLIPGNAGHKNSDDERMLLFSHPGAILCDIFFHIGRGWTIDVRKKICSVVYRYRVAREYVEVGIKTPEFNSISAANNSCGVNDTLIKRQFYT